MQLLGLEPGTWADWANAAATALAFTVALVLFVIGLRDRRNAADDRLRDQARRIWIGTYVREETGPDQTVIWTADWTIMNTSSEAITNCRVGLLAVPRSKVAASEPNLALVLADSPTARGSIAVDRSIMDKGPPPQVQLIFTDAAGVQWWRDSLGNLELWKRPSRKPSG